MSKYDLRIKARKLRKKGLPITEIHKRLQVSKGSVSLWCKDIILSESQYRKIQQGQARKLNLGRMIGAQMNRNKKLAAVKEGETFGLKHIHTLNNEQLIFIATALYWSEGSKSASSTGFQFVNSDSDMILCIKKFLISMGVKNEDLICAIQINISHKKRIEQVLNFWKNLLDLSSEQLRKPYFVSTISKKVYENHDNYYGICRLKVRRSTNLKYKMLGLIKALKGVSMPV